MWQRVGLDCFPLLSIRPPAAFKDVEGPAPPSAGQAEQRRVGSRPEQSRVSPSSVPRRDNERAPLCILDLRRLLHGKWHSHIIVEQSDSRRRQQGLRRRGLRDHKYRQLCDPRAALCAVLGDQVGRSLVQYLACLWRAHNLPQRQNGKNDRGKAPYSRRQGPHGPYLLTST